MTIMTPPPFTRFLFIYNENHALRVVVVALQRCLRYASTGHFLLYDLKYLIAQTCSDRVANHSSDGASLSKPRMRFTTFISFLAYNLWIDQ